MSNPFTIQSERIGSVRTSRKLTAVDAFQDGGISGGRHPEHLGLTIRPGRFWFAAAGFVAAMSLLLLRAAQLQIVQGSHYASLAESNRVRRETIVAPRGIVYDRFGLPLVQNVPSFVFAMTYADLPKDPTEREAVLASAADLSGVPRTDIDLLLTDAKQDPLDPFVLRKGIPYEAAMRLAIAAPELPGFTLETATVRSYATSAPALSHVLGYVGNITAEEYEGRRDQGYRRVDDIGKDGIERAEETLLRGTPGWLDVEVDARGHELAVDGRTDPVPGKTLTLTIDLELQAFIESRLTDVLQRLGLSKASVVAIDPRDGAVRALVSEPTFDSNAFSGGIDADLYARLLADPSQPLYDRAVSGEFPPGSTFKPYVAYTALANGLVTPSTSFLSTGGLRVGEWYFPDWKAGGHGVTDVRSALAWSVNTYFYIIGGGFDTFTGLGVEAITDGARRFGFGSPTGIGLPSEGDGFLPSKEWKQEAKGERWYVGDTYHLAIGQGDMLATPLQVAVANATIANGGTRFTPRLIERIDGAPVDPIRAADPLDPAAVQVVREGMRAAVTTGSARFLSVLSTPVAGKTGTAQAPGNAATHAWFEGFGPYANPTLSIVILVENGGEGSSVAVPLARDIFEWWFGHGRS